MLASTTLHEANFFESLGSGLMDISQIIYAILGVAVAVLAVKFCLRAGAFRGTPRLIADEAEKEAPSAPAPSSRDVLAYRSGFRLARATAQHMKLEPAQRRLLAPTQDLLDQVHDRLAAPDRLGGEHSLLAHRLEDLDEQIADLVDAWERLPQTLRRQAAPGPRALSPYDQSLGTLRLLAQGARDLHSAAFAADLRRFDEQNRYATDKFRKSELD